MDISNAIPKVVEAMLPRFSPIDLALYIELDLRDSYYGDSEEDEKNTAAIVKFIFHRPSNYTRVLVNYEFDNFSKSFINHKKPVKYEEYSYHDSCWRNDGLVILNQHWSNVEKHFGIHPSKLHPFYIFRDISYVKLTSFDKHESEDRKVNFDVSFEKISNDIVKMLLNQQVEEK